MSSFSWASTIFWSGSTASIARRAMRRSWSGLNRAAFATSVCLHDLTLLLAHGVGQLTGGADDHCCVVWGDEPGVQGFGGGVVTGVEVGGERDLTGCV